MVGLWIAVVAVVLALGFGGYRALTDGRFRVRRDASAASGGEPLEAAPAGGEAADADPSGDVATDWLPGVRLGDRATLVQFSSAFCAPCRATRRILSEVAEVVPGVVHIEIDAEERLELVRRLGVVRTPTTLVLDAAGREVARAAGAPRKEQVLSALP